MLSSCHRQPVDQLVNLILLWSCGHGLQKSVSLQSSIPCALSAGMSQQNYSLYLSYFGPRKSSFSVFMFSFLLMFCFSFLSKSCMSSKPKLTFHPKSYSNLIGISEVHTLQESFSHRKKDSLLLILSFRRPLHVT